jgi:phosphoenolpyruvate carboxykinase (GTP)
VKEAYALSILENTLPSVDLSKLLAIRDSRVHRFVADAIELCQPMQVFVCDDSHEDVEYVRRTAIARGEETELANPAQTVHFDGFFDQARDKEHTVYLVPKDESLGPQLEQIERDEGLRHARDRLRGSMRHKKMVVRFFCLGPLDSEFSIPCVQITDSFYVAHSEDLLYRRGYDYFRELKEDREVFWMLHSSGKLMHATSIDWERRGVAIDYKENTVYSYNTQYAGNTIGLKKLALRLAIRKASRERWLAEHMFLMAVHGQGKRKTYFTGAFPSGCGKTSTSMVPGTAIVGDDLAYLRIVGGVVRAVNVERGIFGIIRSVCEKDDPVIWDVLHGDYPVIFSNVLVADGIPYWLGDGREPPNKGVNYSGPWFKGKKDENGEEIPYAHKNARYTIGLGGLPNLDEELDNPLGVEVGGIIYGGRDPDTWVPVQESFSWEHGVITMGASLESETTAATLGPSGVRKFQPFSNLDFVSIPLGRYIQDHLAFGAKTSSPPHIFGVNYFLEDSEGRFLTGKDAKRVWLQWMDLRIHREADALETPTGFTPLYDDLQALFREHMNQDYSEDDYRRQFTIRVPELLAKIDRIEGTYRGSVPDAPQVLYEILSEQRVRLDAARQQFGDYIPPDQWGTN